MVTQQLLDYIKQQMALGKSQTEISAALASAGWKQEDITQAFQNTQQNIPAPMAPTTTELPTIGNLFSSSWALLKKRFWVIALSALLLIGCFLLAAAIGFGIGFAIFKTAGAIVGMIAGIVLGIIGFVAYIYAILWATTATFTALRDSTENTGVRENLRRARTLIGSVFWARILVGLATIGGFVLFIVPGVILSIRYAFASFIVVNENQKGRMAVAQSKAYVVGRTGKVFVRFLVLAVAFLVPYAILQVIIKLSNTPAITIVGTILLIALQIIFSCYALTYSYTLYQQLKATTASPDPQKYVKGVTGWAIWGVVGWIVMIVCVVLLTFTLNSARGKSRDAQRIYDTREIGIALGLYYNDHQAYPSQLTELAAGYLPAPLNKLPQAPTPADGSCTDTENQYQYSPSQDLQNYQLSFCLGKELEGYPAGLTTLTSGQGRGSSTPLEENSTH